MTSCRCVDVSAECNDPFLNERTESLNPNGRVRRAEFKGSSRDERVEGRRVLEQQAEEQNMMKTQEKAGEMGALRKAFGAPEVQDFRFQSLQEAARRQLVLQEREKARSRRSLAESIAKERGCGA